MRLQRRYCCANTECDRPARPDFASIPLARQGHRSWLPHHSFARTGAGPEYFGAWSARV